MPYGTSTKWNASVGTEIYSDNRWSGGHQDYTQVLTQDALTACNFYNRSGDNSFSFRTCDKSRDPASGHYEVRYRYLAKGPRLRYKVYNHKIKRWVWARRPILVPKIVWVSSRKNRKKSTLLPPNYLNFQTAYMHAECSETTLNAVNVYDSSFSRMIKGHLWYPRPEFRWAHGIYDCSGYLSTSLSPTTQFGSELSSLNDLALNKLFEKVKNQDVNLGQVVAERRMTLGMISELLEKIVKVLLRLKHGDLLGASREFFPQDSRQLANDWLMIQYGLKPLMSDLEGIVKYACRPERPLRYTVSATKKKILDDTPVSHLTRHGIVCKTTITRRVEMTVKHKIVLEIQFPSTRPLSELGLQNLASLAWEVTPYSFVIDWLIPIGNYLNSLDAFDGLKVISHHSTTVVKESNKVVREFGGLDYDGYMWDSHVETMTADRFSCVRNIHPGQPVNSYPQLKDPVSFLHAANAIALIRQLFKR